MHTCSIRKSIHKSNYLVTYIAKHELAIIIGSRML